MADGRRAHAPFAAGQRQQPWPAGGSGRYRAALRRQSSQVVGLVEHQKGLEIEESRNDELRTDN